MARTDQKINVPLHIGIDTFSDPKQAKGLAVANNVVCERGGEVKARAGLEKVSSSVVVSANNRESTAALVAGHTVLERNENAVIIGRDAYTRTVNGVPNVGDTKSGGCAVGRATTDAATAWALHGESIPIGVTHYASAGTNADLGPAGTAVSGVYEIRVWLASVVTPGVGTTYAVYYAIRNTATDAWVTTLTGLCAPSAATDAVYVGVAQLSGGGAERFVVVAANGATENVYSIVPATGVASATAIASLAAIDRYMDVCQGYEGADRVIIVASRNSGTGNLRLLKLYGDGTTARDQDTAYAVAADDEIAVGEFAGTGRKIGVAQVDRSAGDLLFYVFATDYGAGATAATVSLAASGYAAASTNVIGLAVGGGDLAALDWTGTGTVTASWIVVATRVIDGVVISDNLNTTTYYGTFDAVGVTATLTGTVEHPGLALHSKPFVYNARLWVPVVSELTVANSPVSTLVANRLLLFEWRNANYQYAACLLQNNAGAIAAGTASNRHCAQSVAVSGSVASLAVRQQTRMTGVATDTDVAIVVHGVTRAAIDFAPRPLQWVRSMQDTVVGGGVLSVHDGGLAPLGFVCNPEVRLTTQTTGALPAGTYDLVYLYEYTDRLGQRHRSAPSEGSSSTLAAPGGLIHHLAWPQYGLFGAYNGNLQSALTRMIWYRTGAGLGQHRRSESMPYGDGYTTTEYGAYYDNEADTDAALADNELLYTDSGELENDPPPAGNILCAAKNRVFLVPYENPRRLYFSKERVAGVGLSFSAELYLDFDRDITGLAALDDYVVVFHEDRVRAFGGQGPNSLGVGGFSQAGDVAADVGCRDPNSVVSFSGGVIFKSSKGFQLLNRSLSVEPIGLPVHSTDAYVCTRAVHMPTLNEIRFLHNSTAQAAGTQVLVFDTLNQAWRTWSTALVTGGVYVADIANVSDVFHVLLTSGVLYKESATTAADNSSAITATVTTPWINTEGIEGFQRVRDILISGAWSTGTVTVTLAYNYVDTASETISVTSADIGTDGLVRIKPQIGRCSAIKISISTSAMTYRWGVSDIALMVMAKPGKLARVKANASY